MPSPSPPPPPRRWIEHLVDHLLSDSRNDTAIDFSRPHLRPSVARVYPLFILLYTCLVVVGTAANVALLWAVARRGLNRQPTFGYVANLAVADIVMCVLVLPVSLVILLVQNWVFGRFLCYFLPMLQDMPLHVSMLTFLMIAVDRYRLILDPTKPRLPVFFCTVGTWLISACIVLPYLIYLTYLDLGSTVIQLRGVGMCVVNLVDNMQEYMRGLFIVTYVLPLTVIAYLHVRVSRELKIAEGPLAVMMFEARNRDNQQAGEASQEYRRDSATCRHSPNYDLYAAELDVNREKRTQKYIISMVTAFAICLCPLMVLRLAKLALIETYENSGHFDIVFTMFVWVAFLPTCTTPCLFASWRMSRLTKQRLRAYFRINLGRQRRRSHDMATSMNQGQSEDAKGHSNAGYNNYITSVSGQSSCDRQELTSS